MINNSILKAIQADIKLIEPEADTRLNKRKQRYRDAQTVYNKEKRKKKSTKKYYQPVIQSSDEHDPIDYDVL